MGYYLSIKLVEDTNVRKLEAHFAKIVIGENLILEYYLEKNVDFRRKVTQAFANLGGVKI